LFKKFPYIFYCSVTKKKILPSNIVKGKERSNVVEDQQIVALYFERVEDAILETKNKYGKILVGISYGILRLMEDAKECENDTYLKTWNSIPPMRPKMFLSFLAIVSICFVSAYLMFSTLYFQILYSIYLLYVFILFYMNVQKSLFSFQLKSMH